MNVRYLDAMRFFLKLCCYAIEAFLRICKRECINFFSTFVIFHRNTAIRLITPKQNVPFFLCHFSFGFDFVRVWFISSQLFFFNSADLFQNSFSQLIVVCLFVCCCFLPGNQNRYFLWVHFCWSIYFYYVVWIAQNAHIMFSLCLHL